MVFPDGSIKEVEIFYQVEPEVIPDWENPPAPTNPLQIYGMRTFRTHIGIPEPMPEAIFHIRQRPTKGDTVMIGSIEHSFKGCKLKKVVAEMRKTYGTRYGIEERYETKNRKKFLTLIISSL